MLKNKNIWTGVFDKLFNACFEFGVSDSAWVIQSDIHS